MADMRNPGSRAGASRYLVCGSGSLSSKFIALDWQAQILACRFSLPPSMAREVARHCFGEGCGND